MNFPRFNEFYRFWREPVAAFQCHFQRSRRRVVRQTVQRVAEQTGVSFRADDLAAVDAVLRVLFEVIRQEGDAVVAGARLRKDDAVHAAQRKVRHVRKREAGRRPEGRLEDMALEIKAAVMDGDGYIQIQIFGTVGDDGRPAFGGSPNDSIPRFFQK